MHNPRDRFVVWPDWGSFLPTFQPWPPPYLPFVSHCNSLDWWLSFSPVHVYRPLFFWSLVFLPPSFGCTVLFWAPCASGNAAFINNSFCQNLPPFFFFLFSPQMTHALSFFSFSDVLCPFALPFQLPCYFSVSFLFWWILQNCPMLCHVKSKKEVKIFCSVCGCRGASLHSKINANESLIPHSLDDWCEHWSVHYMNL